MNDALAALALIIARQELAMQQRDQILTTLRGELEQCREEVQKLTAQVNARQKAKPA